VNRRADAGLGGDLAVDRDVARAGVDHEAHRRAVELAVDVEVPVTRGTEHEFRAVASLLAVDQLGLR